MPFRFRNGEFTGSEARRIAREQIDRALAELDDDSLERDAQIHQVRKRCKKVRGLLRLCRPALGDDYQRENRAVRDAARLISGSRDKKVLLDTCKSLATQKGEFLSEASVDSLIKVLEASYPSHMHGDEDVEKKIKSFKSKLRGVRRRIGGWPLDDLSPDDLIKGHHKVYARARKCLSLCREKPNTDNFHQWRKRVKYYHYQLKLLRGIWKPVMSALQSEAVKLGEELGHDHDLAVFLDYLNKNEDSFDTDAVTVLKKAAAVQREELQKKAFIRGAKLLVLKPGEHRRLLSSWMDGVGVNAQ